MRRYGQAVKTPPFHGGNPGSIPGSVTTRLRLTAESFFRDVTGHSKASHSETGEKPDAAKPVTKSRTKNDE